MNEDQEPTKYEKVKKHLKENKTWYLIGGSSVSCLIIGTITGMQIRNTPEMLQIIKPKQTIGLGYKCTQEMMNIIVQARGEPGDVVMRVSDGMKWASKNEMARDLGVARSVVTRYFAGDIPNIKGDTFIDLGKAGHVLAVPGNTVG